MPDGWPKLTESSGGSGHIDARVKRCDEGVIYVGKRHPRHHGVVGRLLGISIFHMKTSYLGFRRAPLCRTILFGRMMSFVVFRCIELKWCIHTALPSSDGKGNAHHHDPVILPLVLGLYWSEAVVGFHWRKGIVMSIKIWLKTYATSSMGVSVKHSSRSGTNLISFIFRPHESQWMEVGK